MNSNKELAILFNKYKCDKAAKHFYHDVYGPELEKYRDQPISFLEIGVFKGASLSAWLEFFPKATFYGIDIFTRVEPNDIEVLNNPRVKWIKADSTNVSVISKIEKEWPGVQFDVIIDDGLHTPRANADTFANTIDLLKTDGSYFIEDVWPLDVMNEKDMNHFWIKKYPKELNALEMSYFLTKINKYNVQRFDMRPISGHADSYIIKVTK